MAEKQNELWSRMRQLAADTNAQQVRLLEQYADVYQKWLTGSAPAIDPAKAAQFFFEEGASYAQRMAELNLRVCNELFELSRDFSDRYRQFLSSSTRGANAAAKPASSATAAAKPSRRRSAARQK